MRSQPCCAPRWTRIRAQSPRGRLPPWHWCVQSGVRRWGLRASLATGSLPLVVSQVVAVAKGGIATLTPEEQAFTQSRVNAVTLQALVLHLCNAAVARAAADAVPDTSKPPPAKGSAPAAAIAAAALSSAPAEILRALIVDLEPEVRCGVGAAPGISAASATTLRRPAARCSHATRSSTRSPTSCDTPTRTRSSARACSLARSAMAPGQRLRPSPKWCASS